MSESIINRKQFQQLYRKDFAIEPMAEDLILKIGEDFFYRLTDMATDAAAAREGGNIEIEDFKIILEKYWDIRVPEFEREDSLRPTRRNASRKGREEKARKAYNTRAK
ncbi:unnamed protein product [Blepharisma stoltei]|uniref:Transcription initiation factor TFIID subunit 12 domain-containing protein n=1 Tax=Blepharisma stoltei TaxID=1481888 RepID=A0AAU9JC14_9CILI|nr:unnamed protein product [Blepharisma stoltei]